MLEDDPISVSESEYAPTLLDTSSDDSISTSFDSLPNIASPPTYTDPPARPPAIPEPSTQTEREAHQLAALVHTEGWTPTAQTRLFHLLTAHRLQPVKRFQAKQLCIGAQCARKFAITKWTRDHPYLSTLLVNWVRNTAGIQHFTTIT
eukprot:4664967-Amphidinium_carterae.1